MKKSNLLWGILLIAFGIIFGLKALDIININIFFNGWWTLFIIIPCFVNIFNKEDKTGNIIGLIIGIALFLGIQDVINFSIIWKLMIPLILVCLGISIIFKDYKKKDFKEKIKKLEKDGRNEYCSTFSVRDVDYNNEEFNGSIISAIFGEMNCNIKYAKINDNVVIDASSIFGSINIYVPENVNVKINSTCIFGSVSDKRKEKKKDGKITVFINATCLFGGIEIK